jgi:hypothetical protein
MMPPQILALPTISLYVMAIVGVSGLVDLDVCPDGVYVKGKDRRVVRGHSPVLPFVYRCYDVWAMTL